jgi:hypothetical protein
MSIKDFDVNENIDRDKNKHNEEEGKQSSVKGQLKNEKRSAETEVKNAHATGDGSFGRADEIPDGDRDADTKDNIY